MNVTRSYNNQPKILSYMSPCQSVLAWAPVLRANEVNLWIASWSVWVGIGMAEWGETFGG